MIVVEKDAWESSGLRRGLLEWNGGGEAKIVLLVGAESEKVAAAAGGLADAVIMKPLRASTIAACLEQVAGIRKQRRPELVNGSSAFLRGLLAGKRILVVDDNKVNRRIAAGALRKYGANVECAESGSDALSLLQIPHDFDACFMDVQMPEMDG